MTAAGTASTTSEPEGLGAECLGADVILRVLEDEGVTVCFGIPGGALLPLYDAIARGTTVRHVLARHEQGAGHMAEGYARASGEVGVVFATSGPGATNLVTPIADAAMDSTPLVAITGQVRSHLIGSEAFQECDIVGVTLPLVKHSWLVRDVGELAATLRDAFHVARSGRPGPVLVDVPRDVQEASFDGALPACGELEARSMPADVDEAAARAVAHAIEGSRRPVLYVGGGLLSAGATRELLALAERGNIPVVTTLMAKGAIPESHQLCFGCPGMHGGKWANLALGGADLVIAVGARFDDRVTGRVADFAPRAVVAHYDIDAYEVGKVRRAELAVVGALRESLACTLAALASAASSDAWLRQLEAWRTRFPLCYDQNAATLKPQRVVERVAAALDGHEDVIYTTGVGQHQMWAMQYARCECPRSFITSGGHGTMGFGVPAAIGARAARPGATVVCLDGDGSFQMTAQELATAVAERLPIVVVIINNAGLGMVRQWQTMFHGGRRSHVELGEPVDCALVARGFGAAAVSVRSEAELAAALAAALLADTTTVIDVHVDPDEPCMPIIPPGAAAVDMLEWHADG
ncbi:MAG TPA: biosynthetic-type acetolactate synthase large subunit [Solirubrobacteraceae bacterium]|jgi:acetolactate synthase-1/2/3 large subunit|nr:biosynthetic-type acetolactate synthase large subunit [Solirubrobacteraceae bacterium]